jgi:hypothetical protein
MEAHRHHPETGEVILEVPDEPSPDEVAARAAEAAAKADAEARVEVARIEADAAVQLAKVNRSTLEDEERVELEALRLEVAALREMNAPPEPDPIVVEAPADPEPDDMPADAPPPIDGSPEPRESRKRVGLGMW